MKLSKALKRDKKLQKKIKGMQVDNRSIFKIQEIQRDRAIEAQRKLKEMAQQLFLEERSDLE